MSGPTVENFPKPTSITGGCLCGSIRYRVDFPEDHDFLRLSGSCQCTQCRRTTGALFFASYTVPASKLTYLGPTTTLKNFYATPGFQRGFCTNCGSHLYWRDESRDDVELAVGSVDPVFLFGEGGNAAGYGFALANMSGNNVWCENEIKGVTDGMIGRERVRWARSGEEGVRM
ncbi:glutathione-dependent formaldehyde-activating GFA [Xylariaceae sp. FL0662B]|nr:glutathione-dependent formaldehyde-activating GFA [Xylariaceae sp. FL0662B]